MRIKSDTTYDAESGSVTIVLKSGTELTITAYDTFILNPKGKGLSRWTFSEDEFIAAIKEFWSSKDNYTIKDIAGTDSVVNFKYYFQQGQKQLLSMINHKFVPVSNTTSLCICGYDYKHLLHAPYRDVEGQ